MDTWDNHAATGYAGGSGTYSDPYHIETEGQLAYFAKQSRMTIQKGYYSLENSLDMSEYLWLGIGSGSTYFGGVFMGNFNTVSGIIMNDNNAWNFGSYIGFFNYVGSESVIENLILNGGTIASDDHAVGCLAGCATSYPIGMEVNISNCIVENYTVVGYYSIGGLFASVMGMSGDEEDFWVNINNCIVKNCDFILEISNSIGGIFCEDGEVADVRNCAVIDVNVIGIETVYINTLPPSQISQNNYAKITQIDMGSKTCKMIKVISKGFNNWGSSRDWFYSPSLNGGYPIPKTLLTFAPVSPQTNAQVYNYLLSLGFSA